MLETPDAVPCACTLVTRDELRSATVLAESYLEQHPRHEFVVCVVDGSASNWAGSGYRLVGKEWLGVDEHEFLRMATCFTASELTAALRPLLLERLLAEYRVAVYLSQDTQVFAPIEDAVELADEHGVVLTPRLVHPLTPAGDGATNVPAPERGRFNTRFLAIGQRARPYLRSWARWARWIAPGTVSHEIAASHWAEHIGTLLEPRVLLDGGFGVAHWNLHERELREGGGGSIVVDGQPLRFFHFSGYRADTPWLLTTEYERTPAALLSGNPLLRRLCDAYRARSLTSSHEKPSKQSGYRFATMLDGTTLTPAMRALAHAAWYEPGEQQGYREAAGSDSPPHAFGADGGEAFKRWLTSSSSPLERAAGMNRMITWIWRSRTDLQGAFPDPWGHDAAAFRRWCRTHGLMEELVPDWALPAEPASPAGPMHEFGVNVAGYLTADLGLGQMGRIVHDVAEWAGVPTVSVTDEYSISCPATRDEPASAGRPRFPVSVIAVNGDNTDVLFAGHPELGHQRYRIGVWSWELEDFPEVQRAGFAHVDEVWAVSRFARDAIAKHSPVPVKVFPVPVFDVASTLRDARQAHDPVTFFFTFDFNSAGERKNPWGLVHAFQLAFPDRDDVRLVIKAANGGLHPAGDERLRLTIDDDHRVELLDGYVSVDELEALYSRADAYVSLHRSEGFGLTVAEAMVRGLPVIATDYSSTAEFVDDNVGWPVPYTLVPVGAGWPPYPADGTWADPDVHAAARAMREVADNPAEAARRGVAARERIVRTRSVEAAASWIVTQLESAYNTWSQETSANELQGRAPSAPLSQARAAVHWQADTGAPSRIPFAPLMRKGVLRAVKHYDVHQRHVLDTLVDGVRDSVELLGSRVDEMGHVQQARTERFETEVNERMGALSARLNRIERAIVSLRHSVDDHTHDDRS